MNRWSRVVMSTVLVGLLAWSLSSCGQPAKPKGGGQPAAAAPSTAPAPVTTQTGVEQKALPPAQQPTVQSATITFLTGDVETNESNTWVPANIGDSLKASERLRVGADSYCEIQFGNLATARIEADSEVSVAKLALGETRQVKVALSTGAIVSKVQKLVGNDQYNVQTRTAVAGVRGTEFRVAATSSTTTELAVKEGVVTVVPPEATITAATPEQQAVAQEVEKTVTENAPRVTANQQLVVTQADLAPVVEQLAIVKKQIDAGASAEAVKPLVTTTTETAQKSVPKPAPITPEQQAALAVTATMQLLPTEPSPQQPTTQGSGGAPAPATPTTVPLSVSVIPDQAQIFLDGQLVGTRGFSGLYSPGRQVALSVRLKGYETKDIPITVPTAGIALTVSLTKSQETQPAAPKPETKAVTPQPASQASSQPVSKPAQIAVSINTTPRSAQIFVDGNQVGTGSYQGKYTDGQRIQVAAQAAGYTSETRTVTVGKNTASLSFSLARKVKYGNVTITASPANAAIYVNGQYDGTGTYSARYQENTSLQIRASLRGYSDATTSITVAADKTTNRTLSLKPQPIDARFSVAGTSLVRTIAVWNDNLISVDKDGTLRSTSRSGNLNWEVSSGNSGNENSQPVVADSTVFLSGARDFVGVDASSGSQLFKIALDQSNAHLFGRSVEVAGGEAYYPTDSEIVVYNERTGQVLRKIPLVSASNMSALVSGAHLFIVDQQGTLFELNAKTGQVVTKISSTAVQPVAIAPVMRGSQVFFTGRRGTAVLTDVSSGKVVWQKPLDSSQSMGVFTDPVFGSSGIYVYAKNTLFGLSTPNGSNLFNPITNVSASPLLDGQALYYGTNDGRLVRASARTGAPEAAVSVGGKITTRPVRIGDDIAVGTASGQIVLVYPGTMPTVN